MPIFFNLHFGKIVDKQNMKCEFCHITGTNMEGVPDVEFFKIAKGIGGTSDKVMLLGFLLGFNHAQVRDFLAANRTDSIVSFQGTLNMLYSWKESTSKERQRTRLKEALLEAQLAEIAECISETHGKGTSFILFQHALQTAISLIKSMCPNYEPGLYVL